MFKRFATVCVTVAALSLSATSALAKHHAGEKPEKEHPRKAAPAKKKAVDDKGKHAEPGDDKGKAKHGNDDGPNHR